MNTSAMNDSVINRLQDKYPHHTLTVLDIRTATLREDANGKDLSFSKTMVRAQKPRCQERVDLSEFDEELEMFLHVGRRTVYYMPTGYNRYCLYRTNVFATGSVMDDVSQMVTFGLEQSKEMHGEMKLGETRMFCLKNDQTINPYAAVHVTVQREQRAFHVAAEVRTDKGPGYQAMLSMQFPAEDLQQAIANQAGNIAYYLN